MKWFLKLDRWLQIVIVIAFLGLVYIIYKRIQKWIDQGDYQTTVDDAEKELTASIKNKPLSHPESTYSGLANQFFNLIDGCDFWTNSEKVVQIFNNIHNDSDYLMLVKKFGVREIDNCGPGTGSYQADLPSAFKKENLTSIAGAINLYFMKQGMKSRI